MIAVPTIRLASMNDAPAIAQMSRQYIEQGLGWSWNVYRIEAAIRSDSTNVAVIHERGEVIGFGIMQYGDQTAHLSLLAVHPNYRRQALAARLLAWLESCADTAGIARIGVEARSDNPVAIAFYQKQGYVQLARVAGYYRGVLDAVRLEKILRPIFEGNF
jgi:ribosomal-protein-alanine N-acetyltransferase